MSLLATTPGKPATLTDYGGLPLRMRPAASDITFADIWRVLRKRRKLIAAVCAGVFVLAVLMTVLSTPKYKASATIEVNRQNNDLLSLDDMQASMTDLKYSDYSIIQQTEAKVLQTDSLLLQVAKDLKLESRPEFSRKPLVDYFRSIPDESKLPLEQAPNRRTRVLKTFAKNLRVDSVPGTRLLTIQFMSPDPQVAADVVNTLIRDRREESFELRSSATMEENAWLTKQLQDLKDQVQDSQQRLVDYQKEAGILGVDETHNIIMSRLEDLNQQVITAEANRILAQTVLHLVQNGSPELVSGLVGPSLSGSNRVNPDSLNLLARLREHQNDLKIQYAEASRKYGEAYPKLIELQAQIEENEKSINEELGNLASRAENDYNAARETENALRAALEREKGEANKLNDSSVRYSILKHEVDASRDLYDSMLKKLKAAGILAGLRFTNIVALDSAKPADRPARPIIPLNLAVGLFGGFLLGVAAGFAKENVDQTISTPDQAEVLAGVPVLGTVPRWRAISRRKASRPRNLSACAESLRVITQPRSPAAESYRFLRASLQLLDNSGSTRVLMFTSGLPGEGKTTTSINCAAALANQGAKVLLVEADLRKPKFEDLLRLNSPAGLSEVLTEPGRFQSYVPCTGVPGLSVLPAGSAVDSPSELLGSEKFRQCMMKWRESFNYVIVDTPPILSVADAMSVAPLCDTIILVVRYGETTEQSLLRATNLLSRVPGGVNGVVVNSFDATSPDFDRYYGYKYESSEGAEYYPMNTR